MSRMKHQIKQARKIGMTPMDVARMRAIAQAEAKKVENQATEKAFLYMLAIPLNVLVDNYWRKSGKRRAKKFIEDVLSLYEAVEQGVVTDEDLNEFLWDMAGLKVGTEWLERSKKHDS